MKIETVMHEKTVNVLKNSAKFNTDLILYWQTLLCSLFTFSLITAYYIVNGYDVSVALFNKVTADTSFLIIGLSLILSSICYFFNFADRFIIYRKHLGLLGFAILLIHILISITYKAYSPFPEYYLTESRVYSFLSALIATIIFAFMALISNRVALLKIGPKMWRALLRLGFLGYVFSLYHFGAKNQENWIEYLANRSSILPPMSLIIFIFGFLVILLRLILFIKVRR